MFYLVNPWLGPKTWFLVAASGVYTISGQAANLIRQRGLAAAAGSYTIAGQTVNMYKSVGLAAEHGTYAITGQSAALLRQLKFSAAVGTYTIAGQVASLLKQLRLDCQVGVYTIAGQDAQLTIRRLQADAGVYAVQGQAAQLLYARLMSAEVGNYAIAGQSADLRKTINMAADLGQYVVSGQDVQLTIRRLLADVGVYQVTGQSVGLFFGRLLAAAVGDYVVAGQAVELARAYSVGANVGGYIVSGQDVNLRRALSLLAAAGTYTVAGQNVTLTYTKIPALSFGQNGSNATDTSTPSVTGLSIGAAASDRFVIAVMSWAGGVDLNSFTIGGIAGSIIQQPVAGGPRIAIGTAAVPTGTTATVAGVMSGTATRFGAGVWRVVNLNSITPADTALDEGASDGTRSINIDIPANGFVIAGNTSGSNTAITPTNYTERYDASIAGETSQMEGGDYTATTAEVNRNLQATNSRHLIAASFV